MLSDVPITADLVRGAVELEPGRRGLVPHRLPAQARAQNADPQLAMAEQQPSGVHLVLRTRATVVELETLPTKRVYVVAPGQEQTQPDGVYDLVVDGEVVDHATVPGGSALVIDLTTGGYEHRPGEPGALRFDSLSDADKQVEIWLPHGETTELVSMRADAPVQPVPAAGPVWLHHGSSISQGSNAATPTGIWPVVAARRAGVELVNLGFGGGALLDPFTARAMRDLPADLISVKIGINLVNADLMRLRALGPAVHGFLDTLRDGHPTTPLLVVSALACPIHEETPGPAAADSVDGRVRFRATGDPADVAAGRLTLAVVRRELARVVAERSGTDPHLHYLDGLALFGLDDVAGHPLPDDLHLSPDGHRLVGEQFAAQAFGPGGPFHHAGDDSGV